MLVALRAPAHGAVVIAVYLTIRKGLDMQNFENRLLASTRWTWVGLASALILGACTGNTDTASSKDVITETNEAGQMVRVSRPDATGTDQQEETTPREAEGILAGCTHIRFCNAPGAAEVVCDTNDNPACSRQQRLDECFSDADAVCGNWTTMDFDPPI
jgi:hypothetical protein